jgi:hypothetical protein
MKSLLLDRDAWDLVLDANGNIACCWEPYARAQDVACACRLFIQEQWYDMASGIPYDAEILGHWPPLSLVRERLRQAALTVDGVVSAQVFITDVTGRKIKGQVQFIDVDGQTRGVTF